MIRFSFLRLLPGLLWLLFSLTNRGVVAQILAKDSLRPALKKAQNLRAKGDYAAAEPIFAAVFAAASTHYGVQDTFTARVQMDLGLIRYFAGNFRQALADYQGALAGFRAANGSRSRDTLECFYRTGVVLRELGDLYRAEDFIEAALAIVAQSPANHQLAIGKYHNALGNITLRQARYVVARHHFMQAKAALIPLLGGNSAHIGALNTNLGMAYLQLDSLPQALATQKLALQIFRKSLPPTHPSIGNTFLNLGEILLKMNQTEQALAAFHKAQSFWAKNLSPGHVNHVIAKNRLGDVALAKQNGFLALQHYQAALQLLAPGNTGPNWRENPAPNSVRSEVELLETWTRKAKALALCHEQEPATFPLEEIFAVYHQISKLCDHMRRGYRRASSQQFLSGRTLPVYEEAIALAWATAPEKGAAEAFSFAEQSKAVLLYAALKGAEAQHFAGIPPLLLKREAAQKEALVALNQKLDKLALKQGAKARQSYRKMIKKRFRMEQVQEALLDTFQRDYPRYFELKYAHKVVSLPALQAKLGREAENTPAMLVYFWGDTYLYGWAITATTCKFLRLGRQAEIGLACDTLLARVSGRLPLGQTAQKVYALVLAPLLDALNAPDLKRLRVVRDGKLEYIPFALLQPQPATFLVERYAISYVASATTAMASRPIRSAPKPYLGLGLTFPGGITLDGAVRQQSLAALPYTAEETAAGQKVFGGSRWLDAQASEAKFRAEADQYSILHLATHTLIDDQNPLYSRLLLQGSGEMDGHLHTYELFGMNLNAELVVLSACNTGRGSLQRGEGMMSLARGFAYAGCPGVMMTHWTVNDRQNAELMAEFFRGLAAAMPKDQALQAAQLAYLKSADEITGHPWYWAAPGLLGEVAPLSNIDHSNWKAWIWLGLAACFLLFSLIFWRMKRQKLVSNV
ncbi:MAG TPA: CHAT domain-containing protein [Bacteroidetes bacterium]|nr:CHAT domain-containing protein [Bacteroidota bacterium]